MRTLNPRQFRNRTVVVGLLFVILAVPLKSLLSTDIDEVAAPDAAAIVATQVEIVTVARGDDAIRFNCRVTNPNKFPVTFHGFRPDSYDPPLKDGNLMPIESIQVMHNGKWDRLQKVIYCGTGLDDVPLAAGGSGTFGASAPFEPAWEAVRIGIYWKAPRNNPAVNPESDVAWSQPLTFGEVEKRIAASEPPRPEPPAGAIFTGGGLRTRFDFDDFSETNALNLVGEARTANNRLRLTSASPYTTGAAWYVDKVFVAGEFETTFQFQLATNEGGADGSDGFAFLIQNSGPVKLTGGGGNLGYSGIPNSLAVEFDTWCNAEFGDRNHSHVSVHTNGTQNNSVNESCSLGSHSPADFVLDDTRVHTVRIKYTVGKLSIQLDERPSPIITLIVDLGKTLELDHGRAWIGFTASAGSPPLKQEILNWSFAAKVGARPPVADVMRGEAAGEVRDDNHLKMKFVWCPPGSLTMENVERIAEPGVKQADVSEDVEFDRQDQPASKKPGTATTTPVNVILTEGYWLGKYEVTQSEWKEVMKTEPWKGQESTREGADFPTTFVSWDEASDFCRKLTEAERQAGRLPKHWEYTLPTEAQWEYGCRARTQTKFSYGDDESKLGDVAWFVANTSLADESYAHQVGQKQANPWGLCDVHGNVWEWCRDVHADTLPGGRDPEVKPDENAQSLDRVNRGGGWIGDASKCRSANRDWIAPVARLNHLGFRPALSSVR